MSANMTISSAYVQLLIRSSFNRTPEFVSSRFLIHAVFLIVGLKLLKKRFRLVSVVYLVIKFLLVYINIFILIDIY